MSRARKLVAYRRSSVLKIVSLGTHKKTRQRPRKRQCPHVCRPCRFGSIDLQSLIAAKKGDWAASRDFRQERPFGQEEVEKCPVPNRHILEKMDK